MAVGYRAVGWNPEKKRYDRFLAFGVIAYLALFVGLGAALHPDATAETLLIRGLGTCAFFLLHVVLLIGPLCRLSPRFLPLLYNRRHLGVTTFLLGAAHGLFSLIQFHALGNENPIVSVFTANTTLDSVAHFPFQPFGFFALVVLFLMAATSHDFWLANLSAPVWKLLHMLVYPAYVALIAHVAFGVLQAETSPLWVLPLAIGMLLVFGLHLHAARRERLLDAAKLGPHDAGGFVDACALDEIPDERAKVVTISGERVAIFRYGDRVSALSNVCQHQNGPLGEGRVIDGCVTCPWHGYQYRPEDGCSPEPFHEKVPTFRVKLREGRVWVDVRPLKAGTRVEPAIVGEEATA